MAEISDEEFVDAVDIVAIRHGDSRLTRQQKPGFKQAGQTKIFNDPPVLARFRRPTDEEFKHAKAILSNEIRALLVAMRVVNGSFPAPQPNESDRAFRERLEDECDTNSELWKKAIENNAPIMVPTWVKHALAQDEGFRKAGEECLLPPIVPNEQRVHIAGFCKFRNREGKEIEDWCVLYPRAINRQKGPIETVPDPQKDPETLNRVARKTITSSRWRICEGWVSSGKSPRKLAATITKTSDGQSGAPVPTPRME